MGPTVEWMVPGLAAAVRGETALAIRDLLGFGPRFVGAAVVEVLAVLRYALAFRPPERSCFLPKRGA